MLSIKHAYYGWKVGCGCQSNYVVMVSCEWHLITIMKDVNYSWKWLWIFMRFISRIWSCIHHGSIFWVTLDSTAETTEALSEPIMTYCQLDSEGYIPIKFHLKFRSFLSGKLHLKISYFIMMLSYTVWVWDNPPLSHSGLVNLLSHSGHVNLCPPIPSQPWATLSY